ncbi:hypothetical protein BKA63DRAFT_590613 [Paraphoma chrysanthemicola]|nr:hypothetical protein BKA63DRAFT_590613 [Paraphoma chrysanthemicola]
MPSYKLRLAASLLRRDMHDLKVKVKHRLSSAKCTSTSSSTVPEHLLRSIYEPVEPHTVGRVATEAQKNVPSTLYQVLEGRLKALYASRDRTMSHQDRFRFRGSWLVLWTALQACPSNESFDIFREMLPESAHISELLRVYDSAPTTSSPHQKVSKMPAAPYEGVNQQHLRVDSAVSNVVDASPSASKPTTSQLWYSILEGASDASKTALIAEGLLKCIWPGENAFDILDAIGHPGKEFGGEDELCIQLRNLLFPGYNDLISQPWL